MLLPSVKVGIIMETNPNETLDAVWGIDSETSREFLIDRKTHKILAERIKGVIVEVQSDDSQKV